MKQVLSVLLSVLLILVTPFPNSAQTASSSSPSEPAQASSSESAPEKTYHMVFFLPNYRFVSTSGYPGRVAEYDSLDQSVGGDVAWTFLDHLRQTSWKFLGNFISRDEYETHSQVRFKDFLTVGLDARSFIRHVENVPFGTNLSPDDIVRTDVIPEQALFGVQRRMNQVRADVKVPNTPLTVFVHSGWQSRSGQTQLQYYDMGGGQSPDPGCSFCHSTSRLRDVNYTTRNTKMGMQAKVGPVAVTYEHSFASFKDRLQNPLDFFGETSGEELPPGVPPTLSGNYVHNVLPSHRTFADALRLQALLAHGVAFRGDINYGHSRNLFTNNPQKFLNANVALNWNPQRRVHTLVDYHQQNNLNEFTPGFALFGNPSFHRFWTGVRVDYTAASFADLEVHYRRTNVTRSNSALWPQFYSPTTIGLIGTPADPFVTRLIPATFSNTAGIGARLHHGEQWSVRTGYEWIGTHAPGYLIDPGTAHRVFVTTSFAPKPWIALTNDFSLLRQSNFSFIQRWNRLYADTSYLTFTRVQDWALTLGYAYYQNNLASDLMYGTDPFFSESLVPYKALSQSYSISSTYLLRKKLAWNLDFAHIASHSEFRPNTTNPLAPICGTPDTALIPCLGSVVFARDFSQAAVPQILTGSTLDYRWSRGITSGIRFQYNSYTDRGASFLGEQIRPDVSGRLRSFNVFLGRVW